MGLDLAGFRPIVTLRFSAKQGTISLSRDLAHDALKLTAILGPVPGMAAKKRRGQWYRAGVVSQIGRSGELIKREDLSLTQPLIFRPDRILRPYRIQVWRHPWVFPLSVKLEGLTEPLAPYPDPDPAEDYQLGDPNYD